MTTDKRHVKYIASDANEELAGYVESRGYRVERVEPLDVFMPGLRCHADLQHCRMGIGDDSPVLHADASELGMKYPADVPFNAACTGKYLICNTETVNPSIIEKALEMKMTVVPVRQGYTKCSTVIVDEDSIITYDKGIARPCEAAGLSVLLVSPGHVKLPGFDTGFIGGCCGRVGNEIVFNGDITGHPDHEAIKDFIEKRGLKIKTFGWDLTDTGSII